VTNPEAPGRAHNAVVRGSDSRGRRQGFKSRRRSIVDDYTPAELFPTVTHVLQSQDAATVDVGLEQHTNITKEQCIFYRLCSTTSHA